MSLKAMIGASQARLSNKALDCILLGPSGAGKSRACGTLGVPTLYLFTSGENHGPISAASGGSQILPICIDRDGEKVLTSDESYNRLLSILNDVEGIKALGVGAIAIDGASEIESIILGTSFWKTAVDREYKGVSSYAGQITLALFRRVLSAIQKLRSELGLHVVVTCILNVKELGDNNEILDAEPKLKGYDVATGLVQQFSDVLVIGQYFKDDRNVPRIQLGAHVTKSSKDFQTKVVRKLHNFYVRLTGCDLSEAPETLPANLARIAEIKASGKYTPPKKD